MPAGVFRPKVKVAEYLWDAETGREHFQATTSLENFHIISRTIRFDDEEGQKNQVQEVHIQHTYSETLPIMCLRVVCV